MEYQEAGNIGAAAHYIAAQKAAGHPGLCPKLET